jgi:hypothetical protein
MKHAISGVLLSSIALGALSACASSDPTKRAAATPTAGTSTTSSSPTRQAPSIYDTTQILDRTWKSLSDDEHAKACTNLRDGSGKLNAALVDEFGSDLEPATWVDPYVTRTCAAEKEAEDQARAAAAAKKKAAAAAKALRTPSTYEVVSERALAKVLRDPDSYAGKKFVVYGEVTQFDSATGTDTFRADVAHADIRDYGYWLGGDNAIISAGVADVSDVVEDDIVKMYVEVTGSFSYDTTMGGSTTVPAFEVNIIKVIGQSK